MAECQQGKSDQEEPCHNPNDLTISDGEGLVPLTLPPGVTADVAARLTTSILLRRAYCSSRPWDQWLLLASLKILHGQETPTLDSVSLHLLQGTPSEKYVECDFTDDAEEDAELPFTEEQMRAIASLKGKNTADTSVINDGGNQSEIDNRSPKNNLTGDKNLVRHTPQRKSSNECTLAKSSNTSPKDYDITVAKNTLEHSCKSPKESNMKESKTPPSLSHALLTGYSLCKDESLQESSSMTVTAYCNNDESPVEVSQICLNKNVPSDGKGLREIRHKKNCLSKDKAHSETCLSCKKSPKCRTVTQGHASVQVTPKKLGIYTSKWVQVRLPRRIERGVQTEHFLKSETLQTKNSGAQAHFQGHGPLSLAYVDKDVQTVLIAKKNRSIQVDCESKRERQSSHPVWKIVSVSGIPRRQRHRVHGNKSEVKHWYGTWKADDDETLSENLDDSKAESGVKRVGWLFHGRPMLNNDEIKPVEIPLDSMANSYDSPLLDPRLPVLC